MSDTKIPPDMPAMPKLRTEIRRRVDLDEQNKNEKDLITSVVHAEQSKADADGIVVTGVSVNLTAAKERMDKDLQEKIDKVNPKELSYKCMLAIQQMSPKLNGVIQRESSVAQTLSHLQRANNNLRAAVADFELKLDKYDEVNIELIKIVGKLADKQKPQGFFNWILSLFKSLLPSRETN